MLKPQKPNNLEVGNLIKFNFGHSIGIIYKIEECKYWKRYYVKQLNGNKKIHIFSNLATTCFLTPLEKW